MANAPAISLSPIEARFRELRERKAKGLVIYLTAGDPSLDATEKLLRAVDRGGADVIELGIPFSDPLADGPVIERASQRALKAGTTLRKIMEQLPKWVAAVRAPIVLFGYYNPILQYGLDAFARDASRAGAGGALAVDITPEEAGDYCAAMRKRHLDTIFLAAPTSTRERLERAAGVSTGFLYVVSRMGVTGEREKLAASLDELLDRIRQVTHLPIAVGFGISNPSQVHQAVKRADAAVVGSAVVHMIEKDFPAQGAEVVETFVRKLKEGCVS